MRTLRRAGGWFRAGLSALLPMVGIGLAVAGAQEGYHPQQLLVKFDASVVAGQAGAHVPGARVHAAAAAGLELVELPPEISLEEALARYRADPAVRYAEPNYRVRKANPPDDPRYDDQWQLRGGPGLDWLPAWRVSEAAQEVVVAVIDTGVDYEHPDLAANMWRNPRPRTAQECAGQSLPCYVQAQLGWNFIADNNDPADDAYDSHGTHIAGIIAAVADNGEGVAGIAPNVRIMPLKFLDAAGDGYVADAVQAIDFAIDHGADILNLSYSYSGTASRAERAALERARQAGVLVVAAAGNGANDNDRTPSYPASHRLDNVIAVAASDRDGGLAAFSNYGADSVHLAAPGLWILSTLRSDGDGSLYGDRSGTSMAAPMVSGVAALRLGLEPELQPVQLREHILLAARQSAALAGRVLTQGRVNAARAVQLEAESSLPLAPSRLQLHINGNSQLTLSWLENSSTADGYRIERRRGPDGTFEPIAEWLPPGSASFDDNSVDLVPGAEYGYRIQAVNGLGASAYSVPATLTVEVSATTGDSRCFIATAAYGSPMAEQVQLLRDFRDRYLLSSAPGRHLVGLYYRLSPPLALGVKHSVPLRWWVRYQLRPVLWLLNR